MGFWLHLSKWILIGYCFCLILPLKAQNNGLQTESPFKVGDVFPKDFLSQRVAVLMECSDPSSMAALATQLHEAFYLSGVDAVAYYQWLDLVSGPDASRGFKTDLQARAIKYLIIFRALDTNGSLSYQIMVAPSSAEDGYYQTSEVTWGEENANLESLLQRFTFTLNQSGLEKENFLINETPEFFTDTKIFKNRRFESYNPDLKLDKLAVPLMDWGNPSDSMLSNNDRQLQSVISQYPFKYELVDYQKGEDLLLKAGFQFVLLRLQATGNALHKLLDYPMDTESDSLVSISAAAEGSLSKTASKNQVVYKYYIKHIYTGDIYLGDHWDADSEWSRALQNHLINLKRALKVTEK